MSATSAAHRVGDAISVFVVLALIGFWPILVFVLGVWFLLWLARGVLIVLAAVLRS